MNTEKGNQMAKNRNSYTKESKTQAVQLLNSSGRSGHQIEEELRIGEGTIYRWRRQLEESGELAFPGNGNERDGENAELREEREILRESMLNLA